jgi:hypothetical protein
MDAQTRLLITRLRFLKAELLLARDWKLEAQIKFQIIDLKYKLSRLLSPKPRSVLTDA